MASCFGGEKDLSQKRMFFLPPSFPGLSTILLCISLQFLLCYQTTSTELRDATFFAFEKFVCNSYINDLLHSPFNISRADIRSIKIALMYKRAQILNLFDGSDDSMDRKSFTYFDTLWKLSELADDVRVKTICEVGFNKGVSSLAFLASNPTSRLIVLDIVEKEHVSINHAIRGFLEMYPEREIIFASAGDFSSLLHKAKSWCNLLYIDSNIPIDRLRYEIERDRSIMHPQYHRIIVDGLDHPDRARVWEDLVASPLLNSIDILPSRQFGCITWNFNNENGRYGYDFDFHEQICGMNMSAGVLGIGSYSLFGSSKRYHNSYYHQSSSESIAGAKSKLFSVNISDSADNIVNDQQTPSLAPDKDSGLLDLVIETEEEEHSCGHPMYGIPLSGFGDDTEFTWHESLRKENLLPYQLCSSQTFYPGAIKHASVFDHESLPHHILITAVSAWKKPTPNMTQPATLEFLAFIKPVKRIFCKKDSGSHCAFEILGKTLPPVRCDFLQPDMVTIASTRGDVIIPPGPENGPWSRDNNADDAPVLMLECNVPSSFMYTPKFTVTVEIGDNVKNSDMPTERTVITTMIQSSHRMMQNSTIRLVYPIAIDLCYEHVEEMVNMTICTAPHYGLQPNNTFWYGDPPYSGNQTNNNTDSNTYSLMDSFLLYHTVLMGAHVVYNDLQTESLHHINRELYNRSGMIRYRSGWLFEWLGNSGWKYDYQSLAETTCVFESRIRSKWVMIVHTVDNYVLPLEVNDTLAKLAGRLNATTILAAEVPIIIPHTSLPLPRVGNMLLRWNLLGPELPYPDGRHTPLGNPRAIAWSAIHWLALYPYNLSYSYSNGEDGGDDDSLLSSGLRRPMIDESSIGSEYDATDNGSSHPLVDIFPTILSSKQALELLRVQTVHAMGGTRPWMDEHRGTTLAWYDSLAEELEQLLQMYMVHAD